MAICKMSVLAVVVAAVAMVTMTSALPTSHVISKRAVLLDENFASERSDAEPDTWMDDSLEEWGLEDADDMVMSVREVPNNEDSEQAGTNFITRLARRLFGSGGGGGGANRRRRPSRNALGRLFGASQTRSQPPAHLGQHLPNNRPPRQLQVGSPSQRGPPLRLRGNRRPQNGGGAWREGRRGRRPSPAHAGEGGYRQYRPVDPHYYDDYDEVEDNALYPQDDVRANDNRRPKQRGNSPLVIQVVDDRKTYRK